MDSAVLQEFEVEPSILVDPFVAVVVDRSSLDHTQLAVVVDRSLLVLAVGLLVHIDGDVLRYNDHLKEIIKTIRSSS